MTGKEIAISMARLKKRLSGFSSGSSRKPMKRKPSSSKWVTGVAQFLLQIADDKQTHAELIAHADDVAVDLGEERKLQQDDLRNAALDE